jgi:hypothetical protein
LQPSQFLEFVQTIRALLEVREHTLESMGVDLVVE